MPMLDVPAYLSRLGVDHPAPPSVAGLRALHRAHCERVAYENLDIQLGRPTSIDPYQSAARVRSGRGGYCYHLNGAFSALLGCLGYQVRWHRGGVQRLGQPQPPGANGNHLALTVHGLPAPECPDGVWMVDVGLGDGPHEPLPLRPGSYRQGPFRYRIERSAVVAGGWRFTHDTAGSFAGMDFAPEVAGPDDFTAMHRHLSTSPDSAFVRVAIVQRRGPAGSYALRGCRLIRVGGAGRSDEDIDRARDWYAAIADTFGLALDDVGPRDRERLWRRVRGAHEAWVASEAAARSAGSGPGPTGGVGAVAAGVAATCQAG